MSDISNVKYPTDYRLEKIDLITSLNNGKVNLIPFMVELNLFEDIYSSTISGELVVSDALGLISNFRLSGTEFIEITLRKSSSDSNPIKESYRIYKVSNRSTGENNAFETYTLNFCSEEFLLSEQYRISKSFKGTKISDIIQNILTQYVKVGIGGGTKNIEIENTLGNYDFVLPNKKLFETINWLSTYALPVNKEGADMLFFENRDGYYFKSLQTLYGKQTYQTYKFDPKNIDIELNQQVTNALNFEVLNFFDTLSGISNGTFSNRVITIDPFTRTYKQDNDFNYSEYFGKSKLLNGNAIVSNIQNRHKKTLFDAPPKDLQAGTLRLVTDNTEAKKNPYFSKNPDAVANDINIRRTMPNRVAQIALSNYTRIKITVAGDPNLVVGKVVEFNTYGFNGTENRKKDLLYSGKYLITAVRHIVKNSSYITVMELAKESNIANLAAYNSDNLQKYIDGKS